MKIDASDRTLGLINIWQVLRKLLWEIEVIKATPSSIKAEVPPVDVLHVRDARLYATINAASTSLSLVDWLFHTVRQDAVLTQRAKDSLGNVDLSSDKKFRESLRQINSSINACHQICNANKHFHLGAADKNFKVMVGEIVYERPDGTTDISVITQIMQNGSDPSSNISVFDMLTSMATWWETLLEEIRVSGRDQFLPKGAP